MYFTSGNEKTNQCLYTFVSENTGQMMPASCKYIFLCKLTYKVWALFHAQPSPRRYQQGTAEESLSNPHIPRESDHVQHMATLHCELPFMVSPG